MYTKYNYVKIDGTYTGTMPWGEKVTAKDLEMLFHKMRIAERREKQRLQILRNNQYR
jgi:hypothetical protein